MQGFVETTLNARGLQVISPKRSYGFGTPQASVCTYDVGTVSIIQKEEETVCDILEVSGTISASKTFQMFFNDLTLKGNKNYKVCFNVVSSYAGLLTVTFSTGIANKQNVIVPVIDSNSTLTSPKYMYFDLYVDSLGNVTCNSWRVSGHNSKGSFSMFGDGTMDVRFVSVGQMAHATTVEFPMAFIAAPESLQISAGAAATNYDFVQWYNVTATSFQLSSHGSGGTTQAKEIRYFAQGSWR
jgi:hypothetical protein